MKSRTAKILISAALALIIFAAAFTAGYFTRKFTRNDAISSYEWFIDTIEKNYYFGGAENGYTDTGLSAIADKYLDRYSQYYTAEEYAATMKSNSGSKSGLGISYSFVAGKGVYISTVTGNSPAYHAGLRAGEWLKSGSVSGQEIEFTSSADFQKLVNSAGDGVQISLNSDDETYVVAKSEFTASYTSFKTNSTAWTFETAADGGLYVKETPDEKISYLPDGAAYIRLDQFYGTAAAEFYKLAEKFNAYKCTSLILDLRSNGGGYVSVMQNIAGSFAGGERKLAMLSRDKHGNEEKFNCARVTNAEYRIPAGTEIYLLANSGTASASEALAGAMVCYGALEYKNIFLSQYSEEYTDWLSATGQELKTARTYGKGIMQSTFVNDLTGEALKLTTAKIFWPDEKTCIHDKGITVADGATAVYAEWQHTKDDAELKRVVEIIRTR